MRALSKVSSFMPMCALQKRTLSEFPKRREFGIKILSKVYAIIFNNPFGFGE
jgi:hypothetical protein